MLLRARLALALVSMALGGGTLLAACSSGADSGSSGDASTDGSASEASGDDLGDDGAAKDGAASDAGGEGGSCALVSPYSTKNKACNDCATAKCCAEINGCLADTVCNDDYVNCILACALGPADAGDAGIAACEATCASQYPKGKAEYDTATGCADSKCKAECN